MIVTLLPDNTLTSPAPLSLCPSPGNQYFEATNNGLDNMITRLLDEAELLALDAPVDVSLASKRLEYMWRVGG